MSFCDPKIVVRIAVPEICIRALSLGLFRAVGGGFVCFSGDVTYADDIAGRSVRFYLLDYKALFKLSVLARWYPIALCVSLSIMLPAGRH